ncbi:mandelate racemase/muconate lactonizing enzyme family protein [Mesorhizobium sp. B2-7-1]|uniref:mandelate racemase/muconate lactonizing enzyme family protein n=1 Tax=Mesorhizobium sp. B2-7-1 TaxID=2589909 RepID=UPI001127C849|nr:mandelate racemase/muconate lactonizing enzyme family protein [Mesorhizobium sp. B2-7-1]TPJ63451.1 mandelate racemase/muconate lactonizing enzyme family protein [Mesorhizobium sp. B2-7-1]
MVVPLKIERIECIPLCMPLPRTFRGSYYHMTHRCTIITRIYTSGGIVGEVYNGDEFETQAEVVKIILDEIQPRLIGKDAFNIEGCWEEARAPSYNILRDRKLAMCAQACVDSAIWDAVGKALNVPLYKLWGGYRDRLPVICIAGYYEENKTLADFGREMEDIRAAGYAGCKFKVGGRTPKEDAERVRTARSAVGDDFVLCIDANQGWTLREAVEFSRHARDLGIRWFEEPVRWYNDRLDLAAARSQMGIPVAAGQSEISRAGCRDLMMSGSIDVCNFDASWGGGPTEWRRVAALAQAFACEMGHHEEPQIAAHLLSGIPNGTFLETFHPDRDPMFYALVANRSKFDNGYYDVPQGPGFGLELDEATIRKYKVD